jgi:hypothetical protein
MKLLSSPFVNSGILCMKRESGVILLGDLKRKLNHNGRRPYSGIDYHTPLEYERRVVG